MFKGMDDFQLGCRKLLVAWYINEASYRNGIRIPRLDETFVVWSCKTLQNMKCLVSTSTPDTIYAEYTYNGDKGELYEDVYEKLSNRVVN